MPFKTAFIHTNDIEGGYVDDPDDRGGETFRGISRKYHPQWSGWFIIDKSKDKNNFPYCLDKNSMLDILVMTFYRNEFWEKPGFDRIDFYSPTIAHKLYDIGVNMSPRRASLFLQMTINLLNRNQQAYSDIAVDGVLGPISVMYFERCQIHNPDKRIMSVLRAFQGKHYIEEMIKNPSQEKWVGWFDRVTL